MNTQDKQPLADVFASRSFLKAIAGIDNFDLDQALAIAAAAQAGGAQAIDVAADATIIKEVKSRFPNLHLFASALTAEGLLLAAREGADVVELGNFDVLYREGKTVSANQALDWTREARRHLPVLSVLCATVPGCLGWEEQIQVAAQLQAAGADILQLEGCHETALAVATAVVQSVQIPVFMSGGVSLKNVAGIRATGVHGLGVGHAIKQAGDAAAMAEVVSRFNQALRTVPSATR